MQPENEKLFIFINEQVQKAGILPHISGCKYISFGIYLIFHDLSFAHKIMQLYREIALQYDTTFTAVEHCVRHAIASAYRIRPESLQTVLNLDNQPPKNSEFICTLAEKIRLEILTEHKEMLQLCPQLLQNGTKSLKRNVTRNSAQFF